MTEKQRPDYRKIAVLEYELGIVDEFPVELRDGVPHSEEEARLLFPNHAWVEPEQI